MVTESIIRLPVAIGSRVYDIEFPEFSFIVTEMERKA